MSDLTDRLRGTYSTGPFGKRDFSPYIPAIQTEAAIEIERLTALVDERLQERDCGFCEDGTVECHDPETNDVWRDECPDCNGTEKLPPTHVVVERSLYDALLIDADILQDRINTEDLDGWQTMNNAPKDGTRILGCDGSNVEVIYSVNGGWFNQSAELNMWIVFPPTHWQPLPTPPKGDNNDK